MSAIVLTGGGTAGHVTACLAMLPALKCNFDEIHYIGSRDGIERELLAPYSYVTYHGVDCVKLRRSFDFRNLAIPFVLARGIRQAARVLRKVRPDVIFAKGGYVSLPAILASGRIPVVLHESDRSMGLANRIAARRARVICTSFELVGKKFRHTGTPLRAELYRGNAAAVRARYGINRPVLLVTGGSQGAAAINEAVRAALPALTEKFFVIHLTGKGKTDPHIRAERYVQIEYTANPADLFAAADCVLTRGGSNTLHELTALTRPMLVVPLPRDASRGDQIENAAYFEERGMARVIPQTELTPIRLCDELNALLLRRKEYETAMRTYPADGTAAVVELLTSYREKP